MAEKGMTKTEMLAYLDREIARIEALPPPRIHYGPGRARPGTVSRQAAADTAVGKRITIATLRGIRSKLSGEPVKY